MTIKLWSGSKLEDSLHPELIQKFSDNAHDLGIDIAIISIGRTLDVQLAYYAQGRLSLEQINGFRSVAKLSKIDEFDAKDIITWSINSRFEDSTIEPESLS